MKPKCEDCRYWEAQGKKEGYCYRYPPQVCERLFAEFPLTSPESWCGEFKEKEEKCKAK